MNDAPDNLRDPELSRLYGQVSQAEPPPALDAAILAAAAAVGVVQYARRGHAYVEPTETLHGSCHERVVGDRVGGVEVHELGAAA